MKISKETVRRAIRTLLETMIGYIASHVVLIPWTASSDEVKVAVELILTVAIATGIAAALNLETSKGESDDGDKGGSLITLDQFVNKYYGKAVDADGTAGVQCVDLIKLYLKDCFGISQFSFGGSAKMLYVNYTQMPERLRQKFRRIANTPEFVPQRGDICVWGNALGGGHGHVAIATGEGDTKHFYSYDMNWDGKAMRKVEHSYSGFLGVLRPIDQTPVIDKKFEYFRRYTGTSKSIVDALAAIGTDSSYAHRKKIAAANGINNYHGLPWQNSKMLDLLKDGNLIKP